MGPRIARLLGVCTLLAFGAGRAWGQLAPGPNITAVKNFAQGTSLAPGSIATITGTSLASSGQTGTAPYGTSLNNVKVAVNGVFAPIMDVAPGQIDFQIPYETPVESGVLLVSTNGAQASNSVSLTITTTGVGVYLDGNGNPLIFDLPSNQQNNPEVPIATGGSVAVTVTGIGAVNPSVADGVAAPAAPMSSATSTFSATLTNPLTGLNYAANVTAATLLPGTVGQAQITVQIPATVPSGQYVLQFTQGTNASTPVAVNVDQPPSLASVSPGSFVVGGSGGTLTINGTNLTNVTSVNFNGPSGQVGLDTVTQTATQITAVLAGDALMLAGNAQLTAVDNFGNASNALAFTIASQLTFSAQPVAPAITGAPYMFAPVSGGITPYACTMTGALPSGVTLNATTCAVGGTPAGGSAGVYNYTVNASDSTSTPQTGSMSYSLTVVQALTVAAVPTAIVSTPYATSPVSGGTTPYSCSIGTGSLPAGLSLNGCTISGTPTAVGSNNFSLQAIDSGRPAQMVTQAETIPVAAVLALTAGPLPGAITSVSYNTGALASGGITPYNCTSGSLPPGLTLNATTCVIGGTPTSTGLYNFSVTAVDSGNPHQLVFKGYSILVAPLLTLSTPPLPNGVVNATYPQTTVVSGGTTAYNCTVSLGSLPPGLSLNATACAITGTPTVANTYNFTIHVADSGNPIQTASQAYSVIIEPTLTATAPPLPGAVNTVAYTTAALVTGGTTPYSCTSGTLPNGLTLNATTCIISGTPTSTGLYNFTVSGVDSGNPVQRTSQGYSILVAPLLTLSTPPLPNGVVGGTYPQTTVVSGGTTAYNCTVSLGSLPPGLSLNATACAITGTPTVANTYNFTIHVADSGNPIQTASQAYSVIIEPTLTATAPPLPGAVNTVSYTTAALVIGGTTPYSCTSGTLPNGLTLNATTCIISGTPTSTGLYNFTVSGVDSGNPVQRTSQDYSILVAPLLTLSAPPLPNGVVGGTYPQTTVVSGGTTAYNCTVSLGSLPPGLSLNATACAITGTPTVANTYNFTIHVADSGNPIQTASQAYSVTIEPTLTATAPPLPGAVNTVSYATAALVTGGTTPYNCTSGTLPNGLTLNATTCIISGTPTSTGLYNFTVSAVDSGNPVQRTSQGYSVLVAPLLTLSTPPLPNGVVNATYPQTTVVSGGTTAYNCTVSLGSLPPGLSLNATACAITGTPTVAATYSFTIHVADSGNPIQTASQAYSVIIEPTLTATAPPLPGAINSVSYTTAALVTGGTTPYSCTSGTLPNGLTLNATTCIISGTPTSTGLYNFTVSAVDSGNPVQRTSQGYSILVAPLLTLSAPPLPNGVVGGTYPQTTVASGGTTAYNCTVSLGSLPPGLSLNATSCAITGTPTVANTYNFAIHVADSGSPVQTASQAYSVIIEPTLTATAPPLPGAVNTVAYTTAALVTGGTMPYICTSGTLPNGLTLNATTCIISGTPTSTGLYNFTVSAVDSANPVQRTSQGYSISVAPLLTLIAPPLPNGIVGATYPQTTLASGGTAAYNCTISAGALPGGLSLNASSCALTGTPTVAGPTNFTIHVADSGSPVQTASQAYSITISPTLTPAAPPLPGAITTVSYTSPVLATGGTTPYTCTSGTLPPGLTLNVSTCIIGGIPTSTGLYNFTVSVVDSGNPVQRTSQGYSISVAPLLTLTAPPLPNGVVGTTYPQTTLASGGTTAYNCTVSLGALPAGLSLNATSCAITGTPTVAGTANFTIHIADSGSPVQTASQAYSITIAGALTMTAPPLPGAVKSVAYTSPALATGGTTPYTCTSGSLPPGLTLNASTCVIGGTPTSTGQYSFTVSATDAGNPVQHTSQNYSITVASLLTALAPPLPNGITTVAYASTALASGGTTPYTCSVGTGSLPGGLSLNSASCVLSGTPTAFGTFNFTLQGSDSSSPAQTVNQAYSITVVQVMTAFPPPLPAAINTVAYTSPATVRGGTTPYSCSVTGGSLPAGLSLNTTTCVIGGTPTTAATYNFTIGGSDSGSPVQHTSQSYSMTIAPLLTSLATVPGGVLNAAYPSTAVVSGGTTPYNCSIASGALPMGLSLGGTTCAITGTPTAAGMFTFGVNYQDSGSPVQSGNRVYNVTIAPILTMTAPPLAGAITTVSYTSPVLVSGGTSPDTCALSAGALPTGLNLNASTCVISGTPSAAATFSFTIGATDGGSPVQHASQSYSIVVATLLTSAPSPLAGGVAAAAYTSIALVTGGTTPYTCAVGSGALPAGMSLNAATCVLSGTPGAPGTYSFGVQASDSGSPAQSVNPQYSLTVASLLTMLSPPLPGGAVVGSTYTSPATASGGTTPYTCSVTNGSLPPGLTLSATSCVLSGTPTNAATYSFTIGVTDSSSPLQQASQAYSLTVISPVQVTGATLPGGQTGIPYSTSLQASGGTGPYNNWVLASGALPAGLSLNSSTGVIDGTPTTATGSPFAFGVTVQDSLGHTSAAQSFSIAVVPPTATTLTLSSTSPTSTFGQGVTLKVTVSPSTATGRVAIYDGLIPLATLPLSGGQAQFSTSLLRSGSLPLKAFYVPDAGFAASQSALIQTVNIVEARGFQPAQSYTAGSTPNAVAVGDFNGDGNADVTVANSGDNNVSVFIGNGDGTFAAAVDYPAGAGPSFVAAIDFNNDGVTDLVVTNNGGNTINTLIGNGDGTFQAPAPMTVGNGPAAVATADFDNDGIPDFVIANQGDGNVTIALGNHEGAATYPAGTGPVSVAIGDFNHDGNADLAVANHGGGNVSILLGNGDGTFAMPVNYMVGTSPATIVARDFDNDGNVDLAVVNTGSDNVSVLLGNGDVNGTFQPAANYPAGSAPVSLTVGDFNGDGKADLAAANGNGVSILLGTGTGTFGMPAGYMVDGPAAIAAGEFNHDGRTDLAAAGSPAGLIVLAGAAPGPLSVSATALPGGFTGVAYSAQLAATGGIPPYTLWAVASGALPAGLSLNSATGAITGTPTTMTGSPFGFAVTVTDSLNGASAPQSFSITVGAPLTMLAPPLPGAVTGVAYAATLATGGTAPYMCSVTAGALPAGLSLNPATCTISGMPSAASLFAFTIGAADSSNPAQIASQAYTVNVATLLTLAASPLPSGTPNLAYSATLATGGTSPYSCSITAGALPAGVTLTASTCALGGTPTASGAFNFTIHTADSGNPAQTATQAYTMNVATLLTLAASPLPSGTPNLAYSAALATGGTSPYSCSIAAGALPAGVTLTASTCALSGTPTASGAFGFTVHAADSGNPAQTATQAYTMNVATLLTLAGSPLPTGTPNAAYSTTVATGGTSPYSCSVTAGALPAGVTLTASTCALGGTPTASGAFNFTVRAGDSGNPMQTATQAYTMNVATLLTLAASPLPTGTQNAAYSTTLATGGTSPYSCSITAGALPAGVTLTASTCALSGTPTASGAFNFTVHAGDSGNPMQTATQAYTMNVATLLTLAGSPLPTGTQNAAYSTTLATGGTSPYSCSITAGALPAGVTLTASTCALGGTPTASGAFSFTVHAADSGNPAQTATQAYALAIESVLSITTNALPPATSNTAYTANLALNGGASPFTWSIAVGNLPAGLTLNTSTGAIGGTAPAHGAYSFTVQVQDASQSAQKALTLNVYDPLNITTTSPLPGGTLGSAYGPVNMAANGGSGSYSWSAVGLPAGLSMSSAGQIAGSPSSAGNFQNIAVTVSDAAAAQTTSKTFSLSVASPALQISGGGNLGEVAVGGNVSKSFVATGGQPPYTYSGSGLPAGLTLDPSAGNLTGTATQAGNFMFTVQATDAQSVSNSTTATLSVLGITTTALPNATTLSPYSQSLAAMGGTQPYSFSAGGVPPGLSLSPAGQLTGTAKTIGSYTLAVQVTDANSVTASAAIPLTVTGPSALTVSGGALPGGTVAAPYSNTLPASGGAPPYTWAITAGSLPPGLTTASSGTISGSPTTAGSFSFTATATDNSGASVSGAFTIAIAPPPLSVPDNTTLPNGIGGSDYFSQILTPVGGVPPYTFTITSGTLPAGLTESGGQIAGTPTTTGTSNFTVTVTDSAGTSTQSTLHVTVSPTQADLLLAAAALQFSLDTGAAGLPTPASVPVRSSVVAQILNYTVDVSPAAPWLDLTGGGTTPGSIGVQLDPSAVSLAPSATPYEATIIVTCVAPSPCAGNAQTISVSLSVTSPPAQLSADSALLSFSVMTGGTPVVQTLGLQNSGGGSLGIQSVTPADGWISVAGVPGSIAAGPGAVVSVTVDPTGLAPGYYRSTITIVSSAGSAIVPVGVLVSQNAALTLSPAGTQFTMQAGGAPGNPNGSFVVAVSSSAKVNWTAAVPSGANWLVLNTASGSSTSAVPGQVSFSIDPTAAALAPQAYYTTIRITSAGVVDTPEDFEVVLNVVPITDPVKPDPEPPGLIFISPASGVVPPQTVQVFASSTTMLAYQASASTVDGNGWLTVSPTMGMASSAAPGQSSVSVDTSLLPPGVYRGGVSYAFSSAAVRTVNVTLIIPATPAQAATAKATPGCTPSNLVPTQTGLVNNFAQPAAWPTPLSIKLVNDCGAPVTDGQVVATFSNNDPPLALSPTDTSSGVYSATWTPRAASAQVTVQARATAPGFSPAATQITGQVAPNKAPLLTPNGTLHVFDPLVGGGLGPGNIVQIYGANLAAQTQSAANIPLPQSLNGTSVIIGGISAPLYFVSAGQINAQVPFELTAGQKYQIIVNANGALTTPDSIQLTAVSPGIAAFASGQIIAQHLDGTLVSETSPAVPGEFVVFYLAGMGQTDNAVQTGAASPGTPLAHPLDAPTLTLNGETVPVLFAGLTPGLVGLYQVNFQVPADAPSGDLQLIVSQNGVASNMTVLPVQH